MGLFGKSEAELKQIAKQLENKQVELDNRESSLNSAKKNIDHEIKLLDDAKKRFESEKNSFLDKSRETLNEIESQKSELESYRIDALKLEAKAKSGYVEKQREAFKETIEKRLTQLDLRQEQLDNFEKDLAVQLQDINTRKAQISERELSVTRREQEADAGFADKVKSLADEAARQHQANLAEAERLRGENEKLAEERRAFEAAKAKLVEREKGLLVSEQKRDAGFLEERAAFDSELSDRWRKVEAEIAAARENALSELEAEISKRKNKRLTEITNAEQIERDRIRAEIDSERELWSKKFESDRKQLNLELTELEKQKRGISAVQTELEGRRAELEANERTLELREQRLERQWQRKMEGVEETLEAQLEDERKSMEIERQSYKAENTRLRESLRVQTELVGAFDQLKRQLGEKDPAEILRELNGKTDELKRLREELSTRPTIEMRDKYNEMELEVKLHKARIDELQKEISDNATVLAETLEMRRRKSELESENKVLVQKASLYEGAANEAQAELERLRAAYEKPAADEARYREIELPYLKMEQVQKPAKGDIDEMIWLKGVYNACTSYGFHFSPRIMKAFHTALKTAEWSPITVLAGVSGTGKSELPRLYSHFGGLMYQPVSVQPNWDSQESMLGFFNSIDNKFDAEPVLRFLAQSQKKWIEKSKGNEGYPGLSNAVCLVLLDEMNLVHPELYFADFLSKLELRRGMKGTEVPHLPVKIGAGRPPYQLPLGRNVLWTGTMNQDETTKSLSDKVLDRSIIIHFPRPTELKRRVKLAPLDEKNRGPALHKSSWQNWLVQKSTFSEEDVKPYKEFIEKMNTSLAVAGRAIGHRVWQSIEYYMASYPDVLAAQRLNDKGELTKALHIAFEDQLVQKVMPKLRGIDTRGRSYDKCLVSIREQLNAGIYERPFNLSEDFDLSCDLGYGQFIWQSANYIKDDESEIGGSTTLENRNTGEKSGDAQDPPVMYRPNDKGRRSRWEKLTQEERDEYLRALNKE